MGLALIVGDLKNPEIVDSFKEKAIIVSVSDRPNYFYHYQISPGLAGKVIAVLKERGVKKVAFFGKVDKSVLLKNLLKIDLVGLKILSRIKGFSDDSILSAVVDELNRRGIEVISQRELFKDFLMPYGIIVGDLSDKEWDDVNYGFYIAKEIGKLGIGQTVVVKNKSVVAVEAVEGTDDTIKRAGLYAKDFVVVKVKRPIQSEFMDLPVIGPTTVEITKDSGGKVIAVEADEVIVVPGTFETAKNLSVSLVGVSL